MVFRNSQIAAAGMRLNNRWRLKGVKMSMEGFLNTPEGLVLIHYALLAAGLGFLLLALSAWRNRLARAASSFAALMLAASIYSIGYFFELQSADVNEALIWIRLEYLGIAMLPALWLLFVIQYTGRSGWLKPPVIASIFAIPAITLILLYTNEMHHLYYRRLELSTVNDLSILSIAQGSWYWVQIAFVNVSLLIGNVLLLMAYFYATRHHKKRYLLLFIGSLFPWITLMVYQLGLSPLNLDLGAFGLIAAGLIYLYDLYRHKLFDLLPVARANVFDAIRDGVVVLDLQDRVADVNGAALRLFGVANKVIGEPINEIFDALSNQQLQYLNSKETSKCSYYTLKFNNRWLEVCVTIIEDRRKPKGKLLIVRDITEQKMQEELKRREEQFRTLADNAPDIVARFDTAHQYVYVNSRVTEELDLDVKDVIGKRNYELNIPESVAETWENALRQAFAEKCTQAFETVYTTSRGIKYYHSVLVPEIDESNNLLTVMSITRNITEQKRMEQELRLMEDHFQIALEATGSSAFDINLQTGEFFVSPAAYLRLGYEEEEIPETYQEILEMMHPDDVPRMIERLQRHFSGLDPEYFTEFHWRSKSGDWLWFSAAGKVVQRDKNGAPLRLVGLTTEITEKKAAEGKISQSREKLDRALKGIVNAMGLVIEQRDPYTAGHQQRVAELVAAIALDMGLDEDRIEGLQLAAKIHDVGKMNVPAEILSRPGKISEIEFALIKNHPAAGYEILKNIDFPWPIAQIVLQHHERINGSGYPHGLKGESIILEAKILAVADVVAAMSFHRPYRAALGTEQALEEIIKNRGILYDAAVVNACVKLVRRGSTSIS